MLRVKLQAIVERDGIGALKRLQRKLNKNHKERKCWELMRAVYGVPDVDNAFVLRLQWVLRVSCGMAQYEVNPCIWCKGRYYLEHELVGNLGHA